MLCSNHLSEPLSLQVLKDFVKAINFTGMDFDKALRFLLSKFRLPGEAQKIDRIMMEFAKRFCENNRTVFVNEGFSSFNTRHSVHSGLLAYHAQYRCT